MHKLLLFLSLLMSTIIYSQGCSDAGICTIDNMKSHSNDSLSFENSVKFGLNFGLSYENINILGLYLSYNRKLSDKVDVDARLTYFNQFNEDVSSSALSDAIISTNLKLNESSTATIGFKMPFTNGNLKENGLPLPMDFQPSQGTFDLLLGVSKSLKKFNFILGYQQPLAQNNNQYFAPIQSRFSTTNKFKRASDLIFRTGYNYKLNNEWSFSPSLLSIFHVAKDRYTDLNNVERSIIGSDGLTLNANFYFNYKLSQTQFLEFSLGGPFVVRKVRSDGLTRGFVANVEYKILF